MPLAFSTGSSFHPANAINQRKFKIKAVVLLHILIPGVMLSSLKTINPWLSGCDISHPVGPETDGSCSSGSPRLSHRKALLHGGEFSCPRSCPLNQSTSALPRCLAYLDDSRKNAICNFSTGTKREWLKSLLGQIRLRHCCEHKVLESLSGPLLAKVLRGKGECFKVIDNLVNVDNLAAQVSCDFNEVLSRFDCSHSYSVRFSCEHCKEAYRRWVCSSLVPFFNGTLRIRPCRSLCHVVEQKCPYFLPENRAPSLPTQYAGEPAFLCTDPNIPESAEQQIRSIHPPEGSCCSRPCGSPFDGICIKPGVGCDGKSNHVNVSKEDCDDSDSNSGRGIVDRCPGPSVHPGSKASLPVITSYPVLALSTFLTLQASHPRRHVLLLAPIFLFLRSSSLGVLQLAAFFHFAPPFPITGLFEINASYHLIKISQSILSYFRSLCNKGEYYFMPIPVNCRTGRILVSGTPSPLPPPAREGEYIREHCKGRRVQILSMSAPDLMRRESRGLIQEDGNSLLDCLVTGNLTNDGCGIDEDCNGSMVPETVPLQMFRFSLSCGSRDTRKALTKYFTKMNYILSYLDVGLLLVLIKNFYTRINVIHRIILMFLHRLKSYEYACYCFKKYDIGKRYRKNNKKKLRRAAAAGAPKFWSPSSAIAKN